MMIVDVYWAQVLTGARCVVLIGRIVIETIFEIFNSKCRNSLKPWGRAEFSFCNQESRGSARDAIPPIWVSYRFRLVRARLIGGEPNYPRELLRILT